MAQYLAGPHPPIQKGGSALIPVSWADMDQAVAQCSEPHLATALPRTSKYRFQRRQYSRPSRFRRLDLQVSRRWAAISRLWAFGVFTDRIPAWVLGLKVRPWADCSYQGLKTPLDLLRTCTAVPAGSQGSLPA